jgi:hypothetical protein
MRSPHFDRFYECMMMNYDRCHDDFGYELALLGGAPAQVRHSIENLLLMHGVRDWRDVESLHVLGTSAARHVALAVYEVGGSGSRAMILNRAGDWFKARERTNSTVSALLHEPASNEVISVKLKGEKHHPPRWIDALLKGVQFCDAAVDGEFAMMFHFFLFSGRVFPGPGCPPVDRKISRGGTRTALPGTPSVH